MKIFSTFSGIGGFELALKQSIGDIEIIGYSEIDKFACETYNKNFHGVKNYGDITKIDIQNLPDFDLLTGGFPCQDVSVAGKQDLSGGRTVLVEYLLRILEEKQPKYFVFENVKGLMGKKFDSFRNGIFERIKEAGYLFDYKVLNTKDYGIPQNRERVFIVGSLDIKIQKFIFPYRENLKIFLKDILQEEVDEKYYMTIEQFKKLNFESLQRLYDKISPTLNTSQGGHRQPKILVNKFNNRVMTDISGTLGTGAGFTNKQGYSVIEGKHKIRKLTPIEYERLQGFPNNWTSGVSNSQRYKQLGNAISVNVVKKILDNLLGKK